MLRVKFNDRETMQNVEFKSISRTVVQLTGKNIPRSTAGFKMYRLNGKFLGDYSQYKKIVSDKKDSVQFSK